MPAQLSEAAKKKLDELLSRYPTSQAACIPALHVAQAECGHLSMDVIQEVADHLKLPLAHVYGVVTFYAMFRQKKAGKNVLMVCTNVSCMLRGAYEVIEQLEKKLGIKRGETTSDGQFTIVEEECLAACANGPAVICGTEYFLDLDADKVERMLAELRANPKPEIA